MPVTIGLLFHSNFPFSMHYNIAYNSCYKYLPGIFRDFPEIPINLHISAPLLQQFGWRNPEIIDILNNGVINKQFEILGSSYAQNILYACSDWANKKHLEWNKAIIDKFFPTIKNNLMGFWNPERVFFSALINLLINFNYSYTLIENHILDKAIRDPSIPVERVWKYKISNTNKYFYFLPDNQEMIKFTNNAIWTGNSDTLFEFIEAKCESDSDNSILCYAEDAEATGFWQIARGMDYKKAHTNLRKLLTELEENAWIQVKLFSEILNSEKVYEIKNIPDGAALWMNESVKIDGYNDWFDFIKESPEIKYYKAYYEKIERTIKTVTGTTINRNLLNELIKCYLVQQFEFGCSPGTFGDLESRYLMNVPGMQLWDDRRMLNNMFNLLLNQKQKETSPQWIYQDGLSLIECKSSKWISQFSPIGARCTLLFNKEKNSLFSPNPYFSSQDRNILYNSFPFLEVQIKYPDFEELVNYHGNLLMDQCTVNNLPIGELSSSKIILTPNGKQYQNMKALKHTLFNSMILPKRNSVLFWYSEEGIQISKEITNLESSILVQYIVKNISKENKAIDFSITNEFSPDPATILDNGIKSLTMQALKEKGKSHFIIKNTITESQVSTITPLNPNHFIPISSEFAIRFKLQFEFDLSRGTQKKIPLELA